MIVARILEAGRDDNVCLFDGCGTSRDADLLIAGVGPATVLEIAGDEPVATLERIEATAARHPFVFFTMSYDLGLRLNAIATRFDRSAEPDLFLAAYDAVVLHRYSSGETRLAGDTRLFDPLEKLIFGSEPPGATEIRRARVSPTASRRAYFEKIGKIKELIRSGRTYQTNLTQTFTARLADGIDVESVFRRLRVVHPAPFAAFIKRLDSTVISASPERFFRIAGRKIEASPIKGTRPRGSTPDLDAALRAQLSESEKDRAENVMIVDLLRNDLGRVSDFGSVRADRLCEVETHPSIFHLVSTISARLRDRCGLADVIHATFPCGSITGAPKISTMRIIDEIEDRPRGLSMGSIGYFAPYGLALQGLTEPRADLSVAIRTMVIRDGLAEFNTGGGIVIDSDPADEYLESVFKATALAAALGADPEEFREQMLGPGV